MKSNINEIKTNKNRMFLTRFVTSYSILLIFILIMGLFLYQYGIHDVKNSVHNQNTQTLESAIDSFDTSLSLMSTLVTQLSNDNTMRSLVKYTNTNESGFYENAQTAMHLLTDFVPLESCFPTEEYFIYLPKIDYVMSSSMLSELRLYYQHNKGYNMDYYNEYKNEMMLTNNMFLFIPINHFTKTGATSFLYKVPMYTSFLSGNQSAMVCFEISKTLLNDRFSTINYYDSGFLLVTDSNQNELFRITDSSTKDTSPDKLLDMISTSNIEESSSNYTEVMLNNQTMTVTCITSANNQWHYYLVQPSELIFSDLNSYQMTYLLIIILTCFFCLLMIYVLSKRNIKPIIQIDNQLQTSIEERHILQKELINQRPIIYSSYMARIMKGLISSPEESRQISDFLCLYKENYKYMILYACIYEDQLEFYLEETNNGSSLEQDKTDYKEILTDAFYHYFGDDVLIYQVELNSFAIMLPSPAEETREDVIVRIGQKFNALHNEIMKKHSIWIFGGLGLRCSDISYLWKSYQQAIQAASYVREGNVFQSFLEIKRDKSTYYYPFEMAQQLSNFITSGNEKQVVEIFRLIRRENFEDRSLPITLIKWLLSDIRNTLLKVRFTITSTEENAERLEAIDLAFQENKTIDQLEEISIRLCSLYEQKVEGNKLITTIQNYIKENYMDASLSLKKISEVFNISESYFSYLFKAETKQNFSEYLELIRMDQAMLLLKTTDINVCDMYLEIGYNNANSFRRAFKKVHGVSPKTIRDSLNGQE